MKSTNAIKLVILGGVIAGTLDIIFALIFYGMRGATSLGVLQSIASGVMGQTAFFGGEATAALGLLLHFFILIVAAFIFNFASRRLPWLVAQPWVAGALFGLVIFGVMNHIVLPLSAFPRAVPYTADVVIPGLLVHMLLVGIPIALCVRAAHARR